MKHQESLYNSIPSSRSSFFFGESGYSSDSLPAHCASTGGRQRIERVVQFVYFEAMVIMLSTQCPTEQCFIQMNSTNLPQCFFNLDSAGNIATGTDLAFRKAAWYTSKHPKTRPWNHIHNWFYCPEHQIWTTYYWQMYFGSVNTWSFQNTKPWLDKLTSTVFRIHQTGIIHAFISRKMVIKFTITESNSAPH